MSNWEVYIKYFCYMPKCDGYLKGKHMCKCLKCTNNFSYETIFTWKILKSSSQWQNLSCQVKTVDRMSLTASQYLDLVMKLVVITTNMVLRTEMCLHLEDLHKSLSHYFQWPMHDVRKSGMNKRPIQRTRQTNRL